MLHQFTLLEKVLLRLDIVPHPVFDTLINATAAQAIQASVKLGVTDTLCRGEKRINQIAADCKIDIRAAILILECLESLGYVIINRRDNSCQLSRRGKKFLCRDSPHSLYNFILFSDYCFRRLLELEENSKRGGPINSDINILTEQEWEIFTRAMIEMAQSNAAEITRLLPISKYHKKLIDLGGSHGLYAIKLCQKHPQLTAEVLDFPGAQKYAEEMIKRYRMSNRISFSAGDFIKDNLMGKYDIVLLFNVIHAYDPETNILLLKKIGNALNKDGLCIILDQVKGTTGSSHLSRLFASALGLMLFNQSGGQTYPLNQIEAWLKKSGLAHYKFKKIHTPGSGLIIARKD